MGDLELLEQASWSLLGWAGVHHSFLEVNKYTLINTWIALLIITVLVFVSRLVLKSRRFTLARYLLVSGVGAFMNFTTQTLGFFNYQHCAVAFALFLFILVCNTIAVFPFTTEPTKDLNTTLALGLVIFFYKDWQGIRAHGVKEFLKEFVQPIFLMAPINVIGHLSKVISISFRLFGNIFGGAIIMELYHSLIQSWFVFEIIGLLSGANFVILLFFGVFEGLIQAFVFAMLSLTYLSLALQKEDHA